MKFKNFSAFKLFLAKTPLSEAQQKKLQNIHKLDKKLNGDEEFILEDIECLISLFNIKNPYTIFFANNVPKMETSAKITTTSLRQNETNCSATAE